MFAKLCILAFVALLVVAPRAHAIVLYHADSRPPGIVFNEGITAPGLNMNPLMALSGGACLSHHGAAELATAYIVMTDDSDDVVYYATYVYNVVPDRDATGEFATHDVFNGLTRLQRNWRQLGLGMRNVELMGNLMSLPWMTNQYLTRRVRPESIQAVDVYEYNAASNAVDFVRRELNPRFQAPAAPGSAYDFQDDMIEGIRTAGFPGQIHTVQAPDGDGVGLCLLPARACSQSSPMSVQSTALFPNGAQCVVQPSLAPRGIFHQVLQIILD